MFISSVRWTPAIVTRTLRGRPSEQPTRAANARQAKIRTPCFRPQLAEHLYMTPATKHKPTDGALRAAKQIEHNPSFLQSTAEIIDRETGVHELAVNDLGC